MSSSSTWECVPNAASTAAPSFSRAASTPPARPVFAAVSAWLEARGYTAQYALHGDDYGIFLQGLSEAAEGLLEDLRASGFGVQVPEGADLISPFLYVE